MCGRYFLDDTEEANERLLNLLRGLLESKYLSGASNRELMEQYHLSERTLRRHLGQAVHCLEKYSKFFSENA